MGVWGQYSAVKRCIPRVSTLFADTVVGSKQKIMDFSRFSLRIARKNAGYGGLYTSGIGEALSRFFHVTEIYLGKDRQKAKESMETNKEIQAQSQYESLELFRDVYLRSQKAYARKFYEETA